MAAKKTAKRTTNRKMKGEEKVTTYASMKGLLSAKSKGALPRGVKVKVSGNRVTFATAKGTIADFSCEDVAKSELKRAGFRVQK